MKEKLISNLKVKCKQKESYSLRKYYIIQFLFLASHLFFALIIPYDIEKVYPNVSKFIEFFTFIPVIDILNNEPSISSGIVFYVCFMLIVGLFFSVWYVKDSFHQSVMLNGFLGIYEPVKDGDIGEFNKKQSKLVKNPEIYTLGLLLVFGLMIYGSYYYFSGDVLDLKGGSYARINDITYLQRYQTKLGASYTTALWQGGIFFICLIGTVSEISYYIWIRKFSKKTDS